MFQKILSYRAFVLYLIPFFLGLLYKYFFIEKTKKTFSQLLEEDNEDEIHYLGISIFWFVFFFVFIFYIIYSWGDNAGN